MTLPARNTLAVIGAGPVGLEAATVALEAGFDVHVFERGEPGAHTLAWAHVRMFSPWSAGLGPAATARLRASGWTPPDAHATPTGLEFAERYLQPLAALPELKPRVHAHSRVVHVSRRGMLKGDGASAAERAGHPFRLMVRDLGGREHFIHAFAVIDASGVYGQPNWAGDGGIPARGELYLAPQMSYQLDDVLGLRRARYAGRRTLVVGGGDCAATVVADLAKLATEAPGTAVTWVTREPAEALYAELPGDPLAARSELYALARELVRGANAAVRHVGGAVVDGFQYNSATHKYTTELMRGELPAAEESDQVIVSAGFGPDNSIYRELQICESWITRAPVGVAARLAAAGGGSAAPVLDAATLAHPEPHFYIVGHKSYGRSPHFAIDAGYRQVADVVAKLAADLGMAVGR
jgi:thioredoxin reductase